MKREVIDLRTARIVRQLRDYKGPRCPLTGLPLTPREAFELECG